MVAGHLAMAGLEVSPCGRGGFSPVVVVRMSQLFGDGCTTTFYSYYTPPPLRHPYH